MIDTFLPHDLEAIFAAAFVLTLIDCITPTGTERWDFSKTFSLLDEFMARGIKIAGPYKQDLIEIQGLCQSLNNHQQGETVLQQGKSSTTAPPVVSDPIGTAQDLTQNPQRDEDEIWSSITTGNVELGFLNPDTIQSAIHGLNFDFLDDLPIGGDESSWMW